MPQATTCPHCRTTLRVPDELLGKKVRCKSCAATFIATDDDRDEARPPREETRLQSHARPRLPSRGDRKRYDDDEDDVRRAPRKRKQQGVPVGLLVGLGAGAFVLVAGLGIVTAVVLSRSDAPANPAVAAAPAQPVAAVNDLPPAPAGGGGAAPDAGVPERPRDDGPAPVGGAALRYQWRNGPHTYAVRAEVEGGDQGETHEGTCVIHSARANAPPPKPADESDTATGTGFVVHATGYLVTCAHVVADASKIDVALGGKTYRARVVAVDSDNDLAVIKIDANDLPALPLANSDAAEVGQEVRALGFPLSDVLGKDLKATRGTISGIGRNDGRRRLQIDVPINPGNSGGPLVTEAGEVIGVNSAKLVGEGISNISFSAPSNEAKRLLSGKGVPFTAGAGGAKLEGPALVRRVSPSVALLTCTVRPGGGGEFFNLRCESRIAKQQRSRLGAGAAANAGTTATSQIEADSTGRVSQANGGTQLPVLLGEVGEFVLDLLAPDGRGSWEAARVCSITRSTGGGGPRMPFGPRFGGRPRMPGFPGGPGMPGAVTVRQGAERIAYKRGASAGDTVTIQKRYQMVVPAAGDSPAITMVGSGEITFDVKLGVPRAIEFKAELTEGARRVPVKVSYKLLEGVVAAQALKPPPPAAAPPPVAIGAPVSPPWVGGPPRRPGVGMPFQPGAGGQDGRPVVGGGALPKAAAPGAGEPPPPAEAATEEITSAELSQLLAQIRTGNTAQRRNAVNKLAKSMPIERRRAEVARLLNKLLQAETEQFARMFTLRALAVWGTKESVTAILPLVADSNLFVRWEAMKALGALKDERAAEPIAKRLTEGQDRPHASQALQALGGKAEKAVQPYLKHDDWTVRLEACRILKVIGTKESKPALSAAAEDGNRIVANEAKRALEAAEGRP
jgi:predicted Zn finger-like uncharacterized protein